MTKKFRTRRKRSIGTLPDGNHSYLHSLRKFVAWIDEQENPSRAKFLQWLQKERAINKNSSTNYWQVIVRLGFITGSALRVNLTDFGRQFLAVNDFQQAEMIFEKLYSEFELIPELVNIYLEFSNIPQHLSEILENLEAKNIIISPTAVEQRIHWLASLGFIEESISRAYSLSDFGQKLTEKYVRVTVNPQRTGKEYGDYLIQELAAAARYSQQHDRLEKVLEEIFNFIGYYAERISGAANTDVVAEARVLDHQYSSILDGKSRKRGKVTEVNLDKILDHKRKHKTDYAVVIAEDFSDGGLIRYAEARGVTLMTSSLLCKWIELHCATPLNIIDYQAFFASPGLMNEVPLSVQEKINEIRKHRTVIRKIALIIQEQNQDNLYIEQTPDALRTAISVSSRELLDRSLIIAATQLLGHPALNAAYKDTNDGMFLAMSLSTIILSIRGFADWLEEQGA